MWWCIGFSPQDSRTHAQASREGKKGYPFGSHQNKISLIWNSEILGEDMILKHLQILECLSPGLVVIKDKMVSFQVLRTGTQHLTEWPKLMLPVMNSNSECPDRTHSPEVTSQKHYLNRGGNTDSDWDLQNDLSVCGIKICWCHQIYFKIQTLGAGEKTQKLRSSPWGQLQRILACSEHPHQMAHNNLWLSFRASDAFQPQETPTQVCMCIDRERHIHIISKKSGKKSDLIVDYVSIKEKYAILIYCLGFFCEFFVLPQKSWLRVMTRC